jgi:DNA-binding transcriptional regulator GbsR (MarR family)
VLNKQRLSNRLTEDQQRFVEDLGRYMATHGVAATSGRVIGYLLLNARPVSLDQMAADLEISKSSASVAARQVELFGLGRRIGQRGSRRVLYEAVRDPEVLMAASLNETIQFLSLLRRGAEAAEPGPVREQIQDMVDMYEPLADELDAIVRRLRARRPA